MDNYTLYSVLFIAFCFGWVALYFVNPNVKKATDKFTQHAAEERERKKFRKRLKRAAINSWLDEWIAMGAGWGSHRG